MSANQTHALGQGQEGLNVGNALAQCFVCGVVLIDGRKQAVACTVEAGHLLGIEPGELLRAPLERLPRPLVQLVQECLASGKLVAERQLELQSGSGNAVAIHVSAAPIALGSENAGLMLLLKGVWPAPRFERELRQLDRLANIGTLAAGVAHELRNALVASRTFVDLLLEKNQDAELAGVVRRENARMEALVSRMVKFAGANRGSFKAVRLHEVLENSLRLVQSELSTRRIVLERSFQALPDSLEGDDYGLEQAFLNLFLNALEAIGEGGKLTVATQRLPAGAAPAWGASGSGAPAHLRVIIKDTGTGIAPENMPRLFEPFFTTKPTGTGLGLVITQRIVQEHRGVLKVESRAGEGTTFEITLPAS